ncbi:MAG: hypothetical protein LBL49_09890 [Clostridiales Family XIII bacterium]|jgi:hypothetical protein|nr:hypothetical protein [Clostridiales Family XIII bacterium]
MFDLDTEQIFNDNKTTLREASKDKDNEEFMTESTIPVIDFDAVKKEYIKVLRASKSPKSSDALFSDEKECYFIEFKNGNVNGKIQEIRLKMTESLLIFTDIMKTGISFTRENMNYILVYNGTKNISSKAKMTEHLFNNANKEFIPDGLDHLKGFEKLYFKKVSILTKESFDAEFVHKLSH